MKAVIYLTVTKNGIDRMTKGKPPLAANERAVRIAVSVDDSAFEVPPVLDAQLDIPAGRLAHPPVAEAVEVEIWDP